MGARTVWFGAPGSGKTTRVLELIRGRLLRFEGGFRVIVPSATMAEHLRNQLARDGFTLRTDTILTIGAHARELAPGVRLVSAPALEIYLGEILERAELPEFRATREMPGFIPLLARTIEELANAGCDAYTWQGFLSLEPASRPIIRGIGHVWLELQERCSREGLITRHQWLQVAAAALRSGALPGVGTFIWDGFPRLAAAEQDLILAQGERESVTVTLPAWTGAARGGLLALRRAGFGVQRFSATRPAPRRLLLTPASEDDEAVEIARRIVAEHATGRAWHEIGVVVRGHEPYVPLLEAVFERFGIPVRSYFASKLTSHPVARLFRAVIESLLDEWPWDRALEAIVSPASLSGASPAAAKFEYAVREALPQSGLDGLRKLAAQQEGATACVEFLSRLARLDAWRTDAAVPLEWVRRFGSLHALLSPPQPGDALSPERIAVWRSRAAAARAWIAAWAETADSLPREPIALGVFLDAAEPALDDARLRSVEFRRDAVHLIDVQEARQWELPVVFVCGLLEGQFPRASHPDPILGEALRGALRRRGIPVRTRFDYDSEERFLFDVAMSRATAELVLSYPRLDAKGEATLPAFALQRIPGVTAEPTVACDLRRRARSSTPHQTATHLTSRLALEGVRERHAGFSPTGLESQLECPFQFFAGSTLKLEPPPQAPSERFDALTRGSLVHSLLAQYHRFGCQGDLLTLFAKDWARTLVKLRVPPDYRLELERIVIERSLRMYLQEPPVQAGWEPHMEEEFLLPLTALGATELAGQRQVRGRIDRYEISPGGDCAVYDYKFSRPSTVEATRRKEAKGRGLQAGMYLLALRHKGLHPVEFSYVALKGACSLAGWDETTELEDLMSAAASHAVQAATEILAGRIEVAPVDQDSCRFCDFNDGCRIREIGYRTPQAASAAGLAE